MDKVKLSVITVTFNNEKNISKYLTSVFGNLPEMSEVIIYDNHSKDKTVKLLKKEKNILLIEGRENLGFSRANNLAARQATGEYLFFLNPDTEILDDAINKLLDFASKNEEVGIVAPKLIQSDGGVQPTVRRFPTIWGAIKDYYFGIKGSYGAYVPKGEDPQAVETVVGGAFLIKKELFDKLGGLDEKYFMYFEDLQLCGDVRRLGFKVYYLPFAKIRHEVGGSMSEDKVKWINESAAKYHGGFNNFILNLVLRFRPQ